MVEVMKEVHFWWVRRLTFGFVRLRDETERNVKGCA